MDPTFKVGDKIAYELVPGGFPRWDYDKDHGSTGKWFIGIVVGVSNGQVRTSLPQFEDTETYKSSANSKWGWPDPISNSDAKVWQKPGFLCKVEDMPDIDEEQKHQAPINLNLLDRFLDLEI